MGPYASYEQDHFNRCTWQSHTLCLWVAVIRLFYLSFSTSPETFEQETCRCGTKLYNSQLFQWFQLMTHERKRKLRKEPLTAIPILFISSALETDALPVSPGQTHTYIGLDVSVASKFIFIQMCAFHLKSWSEPPDTAASPSVNTIHIHIHSHNVLYMPPFVLSVLRFYLPSIFYFTLVNAQPY